MSKNPPVVSIPSTPLERLRCNRNVIRRADRLSREVPQLNLINISAISTLENDHKQELKLVLDSMNTDEIYHNLQTLARLK